MALDITTLPAYVEQNHDALLRKAVIGAESAQMFTLQTGVKTKTALNLLDTTVVFQDGAECGFSAKGTSKVSQRTITAPIVKVNMSWCDKVLLNTALQYEVRVAAGQKTLPFEEDFVNGVIDGVAEKLETIIWQGVKATDKIDGILTILGKESTVIKTEKGTTIYDSVLNAYKAIPAKKLDKAAMFLGVDKFRDLVLELTAKNLYHYNPAVDEKMEIVLPGTNTRVIAVSGLNGKSNVVAADPENIYYGVDMEGDEEKFDLWYSQDNQEFRLAINFNAGVQVAFPDEVVLGAL